MQACAALLCRTIPAHLVNEVHGEIQLLQGLAFLQVLKLGYVVDGQVKIVERLIKQGAQAQTDRWLVSAVVWSPHGWKSIQQQLLCPHLELVQVLNLADEVALQVQDL